MNKKLVAQELIKIAKNLISKEEIMDASQAKEGQIVETMSGFGINMTPTGNIYKISKKNNTGKIIVYKDFKQGKSFISPTVKVRILEDYEGSF